VVRLAVPARSEHRNARVAEPTLQHSKPGDSTSKPLSPISPSIPLQTAAMNGTVMTTTATISTAPPRTAKPPPTCPAPTPPSGSARQLHPAAPNGKSKKKADPVPIDPVAMYESLKNRIAALEEEEEVVEEEERRFGAQIYNNPTFPFCIHLESYNTPFLSVRQLKRRRSTFADWKKTQYM